MRIILEDIINAVGSPIFVKDRQHRWVLLNNAFCEFMGYPRETLLDKSDYDFFPKTEADVFWDRDELVFTTKKTNMNEERFTDARKVVHTVVTKKILHQNSQGEEYIVGVITDITELKEKEEKLQQASAEWELTFNSIPDSIFILDTQSRIVKANRTFLNAFKLRTAEVIGKSCFELVHKSATRWLSCRCEETIKTRRTQIAEVDDPTIGTPLLVTTSPLINEKDEVIGVVHIAKDIADLKQAERRLKEVLDMKAHFVSTASHELRTPLTVIKESIDILFAEIAGKMSNEQREFFDIAKRNIDRLSRLINDILDFQKLEVGMAVFDMREDDINAVVSECYGIMCAAAKEKKLDFKLNLASNLPRLIFDRDKITQVMINLLGNALKFTDNGSVSVTTVRSGAMIVVSISDTGPGIRSDDGPRLFQKFGQIGSSQTHKPGGTGLGLVICKEIVERHNGQIWVKSEFGRGATFEFTLPVANQGTMV